MMGTMLHPCAIPMVSLPHTQGLQEGYPRCAGAQPLGMPPGAGYALVEPPLGHPGHVPPPPGHMVAPTYAFIDPQGHAAAAVNAMPHYAVGQQGGPNTCPPGLNPAGSACVPASAGFAPASAGFAPVPAGFVPGSAGFVPGSAGFAPGSAGFGAGMAAHGICFPFPAQASFQSK